MSLRKPRHALVNVQNQLLKKMNKSGHQSRVLAVRKKTKKGGGIQQRVGRGGENRRSQRGDSLTPKNTKDRPLERCHGADAGCKRPWRGKTPELESKTSAHLGKMAASPNASSKRKVPLWGGVVVNASMPAGDWGGRGTFLPASQLTETQIPFKKALKKPGCRTVLPYRLEKIKRHSASQGTAILDPAKNQPSGKTEKSQGGGGVTESPKKKTKRQRTVK